MKTNRVVSWIIALLSMIALTGMPVRANDLKPGRSDKQTTIFVEYRLIKSGLLTDDNIRVNVAGGKITLTGEVPTLYDVSKAGKIAQAVDRNLTVLNNLSVSAPSVPPTRLENEVMRRIETHSFYTVFDWVEVHAKNGDVTLDGWVNEPWLVGQYQSEAEKTIGVKKVENHLRVALGSDHLKYRAVRIIYSDPFYWGYGLEMNPPIHVIVNGFNLILEGKVHSRSERAYLENLMLFRANAPNVVDNIQLAAR